MPDNFASWRGFPAELSGFASQLTRHRDTRRTGEALQTLSGGFQNSWRRDYRVQTTGEGIPVPLPRPQSLHPAGSELVDSFLCFDFQAAQDTRHHAQFQVRVVAQLSLADCEVHLEDHWRVDTDFSAVTTAREPHPPYHFQRGGHAQDAFAQQAEYVPGPSLAGKATTSWFASLQCVGPRMLTPPMCPILAIDYTISQHDGPLWRKLRSEPEYISWVKSAQERLWAPFFAGLNDPTLRFGLIGPVCAL
jgi:hypothetical protein